ncbi:MAG: aldehyde dehydrogenase family protein [Paracoccaceae bacterium]
MAETDRLILRPLTLDDTDPAIRLFTDPEVVRHVCDLSSPDDIAEEMHIRIRRGAGGQIGIRCVARKDTGEGLMLPPTVFAEIAPDMESFQNETIGPVLAVAPADGGDEAIALANAISYGAAAALCTRGVAKARRHARKPRAGTVSVYAYSEGEISTPSAASRPRDSAGVTMVCTPMNNSPDPGPYGSTSPVDRTACVNRRYYRDHPRDTRRTGPRLAACPVSTAKHGQGRNALPPPGP